MADRVTVMKDGQVVGTKAAGDLTIDEAIRMMVGRPMAALFPEKNPRSIGEVRLDVRHLCAGRLVRDVSFSVRAGEIVGLGGLVGAGRTEVARVIFGADRLESGAIVLDGGRPGCERRRTRSRRASASFRRIASCTGWCSTRRSASTRRWRGFRRL